MGVLANLRLESRRGGRGLARAGCRDNRDARHLSPTRAPPALQARYIGAPAYYHAFDIISALTYRPQFTNL